jgi:endonuclease/exonuclease/phosphatase family metal-dependent hydrolase
LAKIGAEDAFDQAATYLSPPYLSSVCPTATPCASWMWGDHVDRVFVTERVHVGAWKVDYRLNSAGNYVRLSDHNPVLVSLLIP